MDILFSLLQVHFTMRRFINLKVLTFLMKVIILKEYMRAAATISSRLSVLKTQSLITRHVQNMDRWKRYLREMENSRRAIIL